jgi:hypothetical protein
MCSFYRQKDTRHGEAMDSKEQYLNNTYRVQVKETLDQSNLEWFGCLTLSTQDNGEIYIDLSFDDEPVEYTSGDPL